MEVREVVNARIILEKDIRVAVHKLIQEFKQNTGQEVKDVTILMHPLL